MHELPHPHLRQIRLDQKKIYGTTGAGEWKQTRDWIHVKTSDITDDQLHQVLDKLGICRSSFNDLVAGKTETLCTLKTG